MINTEIFENLYKKLASRIDIFGIESAGGKTRLRIIEKTLIDILETEKILLSSKDFKYVLNQILEESFGYGPISQLMKNEDITEIMINNFDDIFIEKFGLIIKSNVIFNSNAHVKNFIEKVLSPLGLRIDESCPMADARLKDGSRLNVVISPVSLNEITVSIRKFRKRLKDIKDLVKEGMLDYEVSSFIKTCVEKKANIIVSGATSTGKTTVLNIISSFIPRNERIITIEDTFEIDINHENIVRLESRLPNIEGKGEISIRDLVRNSLRMRPEAIIFQ